MVPGNKTLVKWHGGGTMHPLRGAIAQLGERVVRNDEAVGSIPTSSTNFNPIARSSECFLISVARHNRSPGR